MRWELPLCAANAPAVSTPKTLSTRVRLSNKESAFRPIGFLFIEGTNTLKSSRLNAGLKVPGDGVNPPDTAGNAFLTVMAQSTGSLTVTGNSGIGGGEWNDQLSGSITINGGTVMATGGSGGGAGIGGGWHFTTGGNGGRIMIYGGTVTATGGVFTAGVGSGDNGDAGGDVTISGTDTQVTAQGINTYDIGSGVASLTGGNLAVSGGATVVMRNEYRLTGNKAAFVKVTSTNSKIARLKS